jgi:hypothetical protein
MQGSKLLGRSLPVLDCAPLPQVDPQLEATLLLADRFPNFSICGISASIKGSRRPHRACCQE